MDENSTQGNEPLTMRQRLERAKARAKAEHQESLAVRMGFAAQQQAELVEAYSRINALTAAATALYEANEWRCGRDFDDAPLWEALRDALGREKGNAPKEVAK